MRKAHAAGLVEVGFNMLPFTIYKGKEIVMNFVKASAELFYSKYPPVKLVDT
jgi:hypothetical protein